MLASLALTATLLALTGSPAVAAPAANRAAPEGHGTCTATAPGSKPQRRGTAWSCLEAGPAPAWVVSRMTRTAPPAVPTARAAGPGGSRHDGRTPEELCVDDSPAAVVSNRLAYCVRGVARYKRLGADNKVEGEAIVGILISSGMKETPNAAWQERVHVVAVEMHNMPDGVSIAVSSTCSGICTTQGPAWGGSPVILREEGKGKSDGVLGYSSPVGKGSKAPNIRPSYHLDGRILGGGIPQPPVNVDQAGPSLRCDDQVTRWPGCIVEGHMADVTIRKSLYGAAAVTYEWAQKNLSNPTNNYGTEKNPLHRDAIGDTDKKRTITCDYAPRFVRDNLLVPDDQCDEFPFAMSVEGGKPGSMCVDILPQKVAGAWDVANVRIMRGDKATAICVRSHVTKEQNEGAGRKEVSGAVTSARILDREPFQVIITD
ncbi:hypothetical protein ACFW6V_39390 [Streptomyces sp. NPDC058734]|uniref:hypothetical protein n=1 Tax=Streptomyces sp. NPDC058734 TaxID=3346615 RepID=UPI00369EF204